MMNPSGDISVREVADALLSQKWIYAKTQPQNPHEYCLRKNWSAAISFDDVVMYIRQCGYDAVFGWRPYRYFDIADYQYWTMGSPLCDTTLINRVKRG